MPLDHYVSQVHLRQFYSPALDGKQMYGFRKRDGHVFPCSSKDVCRVQDGSTNEYLLKDRIIEEFLPKRTGTFVVLRAKPLIVVNRIFRTAFELER